jgi:hypothetical protein
MPSRICWITTRISWELRYKREGDAGKKPVPVLAILVLILSQQTRPAKVMIVNLTTSIGYSGGNFKGAKK